MTLTTIMIMLSVLPGTLVCAEPADFDVHERAHEDYSFDYDEEHRFFMQYKTEPSFRPVFFNHTHANYSALAPGYYFWAAISEKGSPCQYGCGPSIYDNFGHLVWYGNDTATQRTMRIHPCDYLGEEGNHLCFHDGEQIRFSSNPGIIRFLDNTYTEVDSFGAAGNLSLPDLHEVNTPRGYNGRVLIQDTFELQEMALVNSSFEDTQVGWGLDCCFQEIDIETRKENFQWCVKDNVPTAGREFDYDAHPDYWRRFLLGGAGRENFAWDFWHLNGVDKNGAGDYLVSLRHLSTVLKIAGNHHPTERPGTILWRLNGHRGDMKMDFHFSMQHAARFIDVNEDTETICFLDNAAARTSDHSTGKLVEINTKTMEAKLLQDYAIPTNNIASTAGNMQVIQGNRHVVVGWGSDGSFTEFAPDGTPLLHAKSSYGHSAQAWKFPWVGHPKTKPKLMTYSLQCRGSPLIAYASWNGATEVKSWRFFTSGSKHGPWTDRGTFDKSGFETGLTLSPSYVHYTYVEALDASGQVLGQSNTTATFVPDAALQPDCTEEGCGALHFFDYAAYMSQHGSICINPFLRLTSSNVFAIIYEALALAYVFCAVELICWVLETLVLPFLAGLNPSFSEESGMAWDETKYCAIDEERKESERQKLTTND